jgi:hypothetical protein
VSTYRLLVGKPKGERSLGKPRHEWVYNIEMDLGEIEWSGVGWTALAKWRTHMNVVMNIQVP